jgi:hypothetical protein
VDVLSVHSHPAPKMRVFDALNAPLRLLLYFTFSLLHQYLLLISLRHIRAGQSYIRQFHLSLAFAHFIARVTI